MNRGGAAEDFRQMGGTSVYHKDKTGPALPTGISDQCTGAKDQCRPLVTQDGPPERPKRTAAGLAYAFSHVQMPSGVKVSDSMTLV